MNTVPVNLMPREEWIERSREAGLDPESAAYIWDLNRDRFISTRTAKQRPVFEYSFKDILTLQDIPHIVARGRKGGSNIAACICNALLYML